MNLYTYSKDLRDGDIVALRGRKYIRCGKGMKPIGVYMYHKPTGNKSVVPYGGGLANWNIGDRDC